MDFSLPDYHRTDHQQHAVAGMAVGGLSLALVDAMAPNASLPVKIIVPIAAACLVGLAKEISDDRNQDRHTADYGDWMATTAGGAVIGLTLSVRF